MSATRRARPAAGDRRRVERAPFRSISSLLLVLVASGCTAAPPEPLAGARPDDPGAPVAAVRYRSTTAPYTRHRPVAPAPWDEQNKRVAPAAPE